MPTPITRTVAHALLRAAPAFQPASLGVLFLLLTLLSPVALASPHITTTSLANASTFTLYSASLAASGGPPPLSWSISTGSLPAGLLLLPTGGISGLPIIAGASTFTAKVTASDGSNDSKSLQIVVQDPPTPLTITTTSLLSGTVGVAYNQSLSATGGSGGNTWSIIRGGLPDGLTLSTGGAITGTPTTDAAAMSNFTVQVKDSSNATSIASFSLAVAPPALSVTTSSLSSGIVGAAYNASLSATGGSGGYTWSITTGSLPAGLSLSAGGAITGTPTTVATSSFTVQVKDGSNTTATKALSIAVTNPPLTVSTSGLPNGFVSSPYNQSLSATGGSGGYTWSITAGSLPAGLSLSTAGAITGTPTTTVTSNFTVQVKDGSSTTATASLAITIVDPPLTISTTSLPNGTVGTAYNQSLSASGGSGGYSWSITTGSLPAGLSLSSAGAITGTPIDAGRSSFTVQVKDKANATATASLAITIVNPPLSITTSSLPNATVGTAYNQSLSATGGSGGYSWSITTGSLPAGLSLSTAGAITGTPTTAAAASNFTVQVKDSSNTTATAALSITVANPTLAVSTSSLPNGTVGSAYNQSLSATGGSGGYSWSITTGSLPAGLSLSASGAITGTPTTAAASNFTAQVKDSSNATATKPLSITIATPALTVSTSSLSNGTVGAAYSQSLSATGGSGGYSWSIDTGSLPAGLSLSAAGAITGTPTTAGASNFTAQVKDSSNTTATKPLSITIATPALTVSTSALPSGTVGSAYNSSLSATGGSGGYTWSTTSGSLPAGLSLSAAGAISGTPTTAGTSNFTAQVKDSSNTTATAALSIAIAPSAISITTNSLSNGSVGSAYSQTLGAAGGTGSYSWSVTAGSLPQGLSLSKSGVISGNPSAPGSSTFTASVTDGSSTATRSFTIVIASVITLSTPPLPTGVIGSPYSAALNAAGSVAPDFWGVNTGQLPPGLNLDPAAGTISGTPTVAGSFAFGVQVTDSAGGKGSGSFTINVNPALVITTLATLPTSSAGVAYSQTFVAKGGISPYGWSLTGALPTGLAFSSGVLTGTPTQVGTFPLSVQVTDANSTRISASFSLQVVSGLAIATPPVLPPATSGVAYSFTLQPVGGSAPYSWVVTTGSLPGGLSFSGGGQISGTPTSIGTFNFTVKVTDGNSNTATKDLTLVVQGPLSITTNTLPAGATGAVYSQTLAALGGSSPYLWTVTAGSLPPGLTLEAPTGVLQGTPSATGNFTFTLTVTDSNSVTAQKQFQVTIGAGLTITTAGSLPSATAGTSYSLQLQASGGQAPYSWTVAQGNLPDGLSLDGVSGIINGVPSAAGTFNFTIQVTDSAKATTSRADSLVVGLPPAPNFTINGLPNALQTLQQPLIDISIDSPYPVPITGTLSLAFTPTGSNAQDDPSVQFSTGGRSATFTIPANATHATFGAPQFAVQTGSAMGTVTLTIVSLQASGTSLSVPPSLNQAGSIAAAPPVITSMTLVHTQNGVQLQIVGLTDTRELTQAVVTFQPTSGDVLQNQQVTVALTGIATSWFQSATSSGFGGQFGLTLPFTFQGTVTLSSVTVVLSNTSGPSQAASANY